MFGTLVKRFKIARTIGALCESAEVHARAEGQQQPGAEHLLLAAFDLPDGTAKRVFGRLQQDAGGVRDAIAQQYQNALQGLGLPDELSAELLRAPAEQTKTPRLYRAQPSGQAVIEKLFNLKKGDGDLPLLGAHVLLAVATMEHGVAVRALRTMGIDLHQLQQEARSEIDAHFGHDAGRTDQRRDDARPP